MPRNCLLRLKPLLIILISALVFENHALCRARNVKSQLDNYIDAACKNWSFQGSILVVYDGEILLNKGYGHANFTFDEANTPQTKFFIGSITKQFTAVAILRLNDRGDLNLNDPITKYLPDYPHKTGDKITIHYLLSHTSGIPNYTDVPSVIINRTNWISPSSLMELFKNEPLEFEPGSAFSYSNSNYILLGAIVEKITGQSFEAFLHRDILRPLEMFNTGYARREAGVPGRADGYTLDNRMVPVSALPVSFSVLHTAGALYSTTEDLLLWDKALHGNKLLSRESKRAMFTPYFGNYGYGWVIEERYGRSHAYHGGFLDGFNCTYDRWLGDKLSVIILCNEDRAPVKKMARGIAAIVLLGEPYGYPTKKKPIAVSEGYLKEFEGVYRLDPDVDLMIHPEDTTLRMQLAGEIPERLFPESEDKFFLGTDNSVSYEFTRNAKGTVTGLKFIDEEYLYEGTKLNDEETSRMVSYFNTIPLTEKMCHNYSGTYHLDTQLDSINPVELIIECRDEKMYASVPNIGTVTIVPCGEDKFRQPESDMRLIFNLDNNGLVTGCVLWVGDADLTGEKVK